jgi:hypothetical protein
VVVERYAPARVVVVERWVPPGHARKHKHKHVHPHYVRRVVYYDRHQHVYFDRYRPGLMEVDVYYGGGRYYRDYAYARRVRGGYDDRYDRYRDHDWDRDRDGYRHRGDDDDWDDDRGWNRDR